MFLMMKFWLFSLEMDKKLLADKGWFIKSENILGWVLFPVKSTLLPGRVVCGVLSSIDSELQTQPPEAG